MSCSELQLLIVVLIRMEPQYGTSQSLTVNMNDLLMDYILSIVSKLHGSVDWFGKSEMLLKHMMRYFKNE